MLKNARPTNVKTFDQAKSPLTFAILGWSLFQTAMAAAIVNNAWTNVADICQTRFVGPTLSPTLPRSTPRLKAINEQSAS
jgi:hypothetical protein